MRMIFRKFGLHIEEINLKLPWRELRKIDVLVKKLNGMFATFGKPNIPVFL